MDTGDATAAERLAHLAEHFRRHPVTSAEGHSYVSNEPRATRTSPGAPVNLAIVDHINASVRELADYTHTVNTAANPIPERLRDVYSWCVANTEHAPEQERQRRDTLVYRQSLEHAIAAGDYSVIPPHRCPACRTFGLLWKAQIGRALCTNRKCVGRDGTSRMWSLGRLAFERINEQKNLRNVRAT